MDSKVKKIASYILVTIVVIITVFAVLSIWDIISLDQVLWKTAKSLLVVFISSVVILFISSVINNKSPQ